MQISSNYRVQTGLKGESGEKFRKYLVEENASFDLSPKAHSDVNGKESVHGRVETCKSYSPKKQQGQRV